MQLIPTKSSFIEKIIRDQSGQLVRATFCVYECGGRIKARLVSATVIEENQTLENKTLFLSGFVKIVFNSNYAWLQ